MARPEGAVVRCRTGTPVVRSAAEFVALQVGPRRVGGRYDHGDTDSEYEVLAIDRGPRLDWQSWQITVRGEDGQVRDHCTGWDPARTASSHLKPGNVLLGAAGHPMSGELAVLKPAPGQ
ncbi:hypothetical protein [Streptomyces sp. NBC_01237]|uniref:hypothetical protein n=1 Tax=Streptomyces sp. NBC_01237 TaxID=2903790 RepID=UPI002DDA68E9|nr:hypothetical protein [Streptomyces sp. NBC_01237]WRZ76539.1 hypothetical protein OG251_35735 [Streptomyces sp. NBC_01237]